MKSLLFISTVLVTIFFLLSPITEKERARALQELQNSKTALQNEVNGLSAEQLNWKSDETSWSIAECVEHLAISEANIFEMVKQAISVEADPAGREKVQMSDDELLGLITNREQKVKTRKEFEPTNQFGSYKQTMAAFNERRKDNIKFVKKTDLPLRDHYAEFPFGTIDAYQVILFMSGHTERHIAQIREIKSAEGFPH